jgi:hypothetical protein
MAKTIIFTDRWIEAVKPGRTRVTFYDPQVSGLRIQIQPTGFKSFSWYRKVNGIQVLRELGEFPTVSVDVARLAAEVHNLTRAKWKAEHYAGPNPFERKPREESASVPTFKELADAYIESQVRAKANNPEKALYQVDWILKHHFEEWFTRKLDQITVEDVLAAKHACGKKHYQANRAVEFVAALYNWSSKSSNGKINFWKVPNPAADVERFPEKCREAIAQPSARRS